MQYDFNLSANGAQSLDVAGRFFKYVSGLGAIRVRASGGGYVDLLPGQGIWGVNFSSMNIIDRSGAVNAGVILAGDFDFRDDRISGTVDVNDIEEIRSLATKSFIGLVGTVALAANYSTVQIWNPSGSNINVFVQKIRFSTIAAVAAGVGVGKATAALATVSGIGAKSKLNGASPATTQLRYERIAALISNVTHNLDNSNKEFEYTSPIILPPNTGLNLQNSTVNEDIYGMFEFYEKPI